MVWVLKVFFARASWKQGLRFCFFFSVNGLPQNLLINLYEFCKPWIRKNLQHAIHYLSRKIGSPYKQSEEKWFKFMPFGGHIYYDSSCFVSLVEYLMDYSTIHWNMASKGP